MNQYYLIAQLPSLELANETTPLPITEERFYELCEQHLGKKAAKALHELTLVPAREGKTAGFKFINAWNEGERKLRLALAVVRARKLKKSYDVDEEISGELIAKAEAAVEIEDPMAAEKYLTRCRLEFLDTLRPADPFDENMLFYYALKLKLILRIQQFDQSIGKDAYRNIYDSILGGDGQEVE